MKCIYWNTNKIEDVDRIVDIYIQELPDLFFLSEINSKLLEDNQDKFEKNGYEYFLNPGCERVSILKRKEFIVSLSLQNKYYSVLKVKNIDTYIISLHFPSQMHRNMDSLKEFIRDFRTTIDVKIGNSGKTKILIIGDFNVNPYEKPMIDFDGFLATNSIKSRSHITSLTKKKSSYYNPTWQLYSRTNFPGTKHFYRPSGSSNDIIEFHFLDQVVISQKLLKSIFEEEIYVIEKTKNYLFFDKEKNIIVGSDHLPLYYKFKLK